MNVRYPGWLGITTGQSFARKPLGPIPILNERARRWVYPFSWMAPLHWYLSKLQWPSQENPNDPGITWIELVLDFEISTRVQLLGTGARTRPAMRNPRDTDIAQRANNFAHAAKRMYELCGGGCMHSRAQVSTLTPFNGGRWHGMPQRPKLLDEESVFLEISNQALLNIRENQSEPGQRKKIWKWTPRYRNLPPRLWTAPPMGTVTPLRSRRRLYQKVSPFIYEVAGRVLVPPNPPQPPPLGTGEELEVQQPGTLRGASSELFSRACGASSSCGS